MIEGDRCAVWWAALDSYRDEHVELLVPAERARAERMRRAEDSQRSVLAAALLRLTVQAATGTPAADVAIERTCPHCTRPHWRPTLPGTGLHASVSHSGDLVAVALTRLGPVGVDVERVGDVDTEGLSRTVLHPDEAAPTTEAFYVYWTRKEAVVKATGEGIGAGLAKVRVSAPDRPAALLGYPGRPDLAAHLTDLAPGAGYKAALAVLTDRPVNVEERAAADLLAGAARS